ncbi:hypothetical protein K6119_02110 [Paracrocinitomix mangrovi]|uniref:DUF7793 family protein n=1 Tax=Paracrocinitomix mangrovi TaxID=2862509 RepID=UPI001C8DFBC6|nr:hypothetical protein [Paracrocinitomix mangrovi]UKN02313.1 hypothetical protein K6119_02110 [Paracrocinitomix mangrovi]
MIETLQNKTIKNENSTVKMVADNIVFVYYHENAVIEPEDFDASLAACYELANGNKNLKAISEFGKYSTATAAARKHAESLNIVCVAEAAIFHSLAQRLLLKFYIMFRKQPHPFKIFQSYEEAFNWVSQF